MKFQTGNAKGVILDNFLNLFLKIKLAYKGQ